jgi:diacylglycerol kinase family enzyme
VQPADFFHILNPNSRHRASVAAYFDSQPRSSYAWVERTSHPTHLETLVDWAVREGRHRLAVWGGDGTFSRVIQALYERDALANVDVTLVPSGTCNDFARKLKLSGWKEPSQACAMDIGLITAGKNKRVFINNAGFGRSNEARRRKPSPVKDILSFTEKEVLINKRPFPVFIGMICNAPYFSGGLHFATDVEPDDGELNSFFVSPQNKAKLLLKFAMARMGKALADKQVMRLNEKSLRIESAEPLNIQADGEWAFKAPQTSAAFEILDQKLRFLRPA